VNFPKAIGSNSGRRPSATSRLCETSGCLRATREGKPHCPEHVSENPYVRNILSTLAEREAEEAKVRSRGSRAVNTSGLTARELLLHLQLHGARTVERLSRELQLEVDVLRGYVRALSKKGVIDLSKTGRGSTVVRLSK